MEITVYRIIFLLWLVNSMQSARYFLDIYFTYEKVTGTRNYKHLDHMAFIKYIKCAKGVILGLVSVLNFIIFLLICHLLSSITQQITGNEGCHWA